MPPSKDGECVKVVVRCRPLSQKEVDEGRQRIVDVDNKTGMMSVKNPKAGSSEPPKSYTFDSVYDWNIEQSKLYEDAAAPIVDNVMEGYNGTIFAYGQTGTGKTHTMEGRQSPEELQGIIPRSFRHVFDSISGLGNDKEYLVRASFLEIYNEDVRDLLSKTPDNKLELKETVDSGVYVKDLTSFVVKGVQEINNVLAVGKKNRTVGATLMNQDSSRSHSIFTVTVETSSTTAEEAEAHIRVGKLNLVDLAGSERQSKTGATGDRLKEATKINLSLSALGNVISALVDNKTGHIPYRDSKLTRLLQDSLGGNTKTVMCANVGPADYNFDETISTLRYANRAKNIKNKPRINEDPKDTMLREFQEEIARLKAQLGAGGGGGGVRAVSGAGTEGEEEEVVERTVIKEKEIDDAEIALIKAQARQDLEEKMRASVTEEAMVQAKEEAERRAQEEMQAVLEDKKKTKEEKDKIREEMKAHEEELQAQYVAFQKEKQARKALAKKLKAMEEKLVVGGAEQGVQQLIETRKKKQEELEAKRAEIDEQLAKEEAIKANIKATEEKQMIQEDQYESLQEEADAKAKKLSKLIAKFRSVNSEIQQISQEQQREREDMLDTLRALTRQLKLKDLIISSFVPREECEKVKKRAVWDDEHEGWVLERLTSAKSTSKMKRPVSASMNKRPVSDYAKIASAMGDQVGGSNPRFKSENILNLELDMPERTTYDYEGPGSNARVQAALNAAFARDAEMLYVPTDRSLGNVMLYTDEDAGAERPRSARRSSTSEKKSRPSSATRRSSDVSQSSGLKKPTFADANAPELFPEAKTRGANVRRSMIKK